MPVFRNHTRVETWTVRELVDASSLKPKGRRKVTIPEFQRRLVWPPGKQMELINSIKVGYPVGSFLMYENEDTDGSKLSFKLIDGLQRTQALRRYCNQPNSSFRKSDLSESLISIIAGELNLFTDIDCMTKASTRLLRDVVLHWIWDGQGFRESDGWSIESLTNRILISVLSLEEDSYDFYAAEKSLLANENLYREPLVKLLDSIRTDSDIGEAEVPIIIYTGSSSEIPKVFELLNTKGTNLSTYEVFAAQWLDHRQRIENLNIIDAIWNKYEALEKHGFDLDVSTEAPDEQSRRERVYTLFEYVFGLGKYLTENYPLLFRQSAPDVPDSVGFNLMSSCLGLGVNAERMKLMPEVLANKSVSLKTLENCIFESTAIVDATLQPILATRPENEKKVEYYHSELQIVSMIASAFHFRYRLHNGISDNPGWEERRTILLQNIPMYYLFHILREFWRGSGDSKLMSIITESSYLTTISKSEWESVFHLWHINHISSRLHGKSYLKYSFAEFLLLRYIFFRNIQNLCCYQVQHVVPIKKLLSQPSYFASNIGPINSIGNLALVAKDKHLDFGAHTFIEHLNKRLDRCSRPGRYKDEKEKLEKLLICKADLLPAEQTQRAFETFLLERFDLLKREFLTVWSDHIPPDPQA